MNELEISYKFEPLFNLLDSTFEPQVDTVIMTGGRYSLKSSTCAVFSLVALVDFFWDILYCRYTNLSIVDSVKPEVSGKIEMLGYDDKVTDISTHIESRKNRISFKGIKTGSGQQTANLKSLTGFNCFVVDEAEEIPDYETFKKVFYSIRSENRRNLTILILNPTTKEHWIFQEFFEKKGLEGGENCVVDNVMYIHTSYLDADFNRIPKNILADYNRLKLENEEKYNNIVLGGWIKDPEGVLLPRSSLQFSDLSQFKPEDVIFRFSCVDPADKGGDKYSCPFMDVVYINNTIRVLVRDVVHSVSGVDSESQRVVEKNSKWLIEECYIECNGLGISAFNYIKRNSSENKKTKALNAKLNKEERINMHYEFVRDYFVFDSNYEANLEYKTFMSDVCSYSKEGDNKHKKDAIDVLSTAASILKLKFRDVLYGR